MDDGGIEVGASDGMGNSVGVIPGVSDGFETPRFGAPFAAGGGNECAGGGGMALRLGPLMYFISLDDGTPIAGNLL